MIGDDSTSTAMSEPGSFRYRLKVRVDGTSLSGTDPNMNKSCDSI
jgi:hypothetical protein